MNGCVKHIPLCEGGKVRDLCSEHRKCLAVCQYEMAKGCRYTHDRVGQMMRVSALHERLGTT